MYILLLRRRLNYAALGWQQLSYETLSTAIFEIGRKYFNKFLSKTEMPFNAALSN